MKKIIAITCFVLIGVGGYFVFNTYNSAFEKLSASEMYQRIIKERDYAIAEAIKDGNYKCCISPPCTMCYVEGNQWNNYTPGTCLCDELIAQGKEACPQCNRVITKESDTSCEVATVACDAGKK